MQSTVAATCVKTASSVKSASTVKTASTKAAAVQTREATIRVAAGGAPLFVPAKNTGVLAGFGMRLRKATLSGATVKFVATDFSAARRFISTLCFEAVRTLMSSLATGVVEPFISACSSKVVESLVPAVSIERLTVRNECVVVVDHGSVVPIASPAMPSPTEAGEESNPKAHTERNTRAVNIQPGIWVPAGPNDDWLAVDNPWIVCGDVNDFRICRFNEDRLLFGHHLLLFVALQISGCLRAGPHDLHRVHYTL